MAPPHARACRIVQAITSDKFSREYSKSGISVDLCKTVLRATQWIYLVQAILHHLSIFRSGWIKPRLYRLIGGVYDPDRASKYYTHVRLSEMYDCIVFVAESTALKPLK
jgi:erythromycin esterase-like protein